MHIAHKLLLIRKHSLIIFAYLNLKHKDSFGKFENLSKIFLQKF